MDLSNIPRITPSLAGFFHQIEVLSGAIQINPAISCDLVRSRGDLAYSRAVFLLFFAVRAHSRFEILAGTILMLEHIAKQDADFHAVNSYCRRLKRRRCRIGPNLPINAESTGTVYLGIGALSNGTRCLFLPIGGRAVRRVGPGPRRSRGGGARPPP